MKIYYGTTFDKEHKARTVFATVTGEMADGTLVYTEIEQTESGTMIRNKAGQPKLILDNQFTRHLKYGMQTFNRI